MTRAFFSTSSARTSPFAVRICCFKVSIFIRAPLSC
jgi:hypothetical protein